MNVSTLVRRSATLALVGAAVTACSDAPIAPTSRTAPAPTAAQYRTVVVPLTAVAATAGERNGPRFDVAPDVIVTATYNFTIDPAANMVFAVGNNTLRIPAQSVCDPATSGYGDGTWDLPCSALQAPLQIVGTVGTRDGHAFMSFTPALRFAPSADSTHWVTLTLTDTTSILGGIRYSIDWNRPTDGTWVDESKADATMLAHLNATTRQVWRRLKHFSGYNISTGENCDPTIGDPNCINTGFNGGD